MSIRSQLSDVRETLPEGVTLVAVSKTHAPALIEEAYAAGQRIFGESRPQELAAKYEERYAKFRKLYPALKETF